MSGISAAAAAGPGGIIFRQLFDRVSCTYSYLLADGSSRLALLIDPVRDLVQRDLSLIQDLGLKLKYVLNTHVHADHVTGSGAIKQQVEGVSSVISKASGAAADLLVSDGDVISCGDSIRLTVLSTPGHTAGCVTYVDYGNKFAFTGDALLIRGCGRTDFQEGNAETLYQSVRGKIFQLPDDFHLYPAHDYKGFTVTSVAEEKAHNPRLSKSLHEFVDIMHNLNLDYPKMIDVAVPANLLCGIQPPTPTPTTTS